MKEYIYFAIDEYHGYVKIGRSKNPKSRLTSLQTANPFIKKILVNELPFWVEQVLHDFFESRKIFNEWFSFSEYNSNKLSFTQVFSIEIIELVKELHEIVHSLQKTKLISNKSRVKNRSLKQVICLEKLNEKLHYLAHPTKQI